MSHPGKSPCDEGVLRSGGGARPCDGRTEWWILTATILGSSMAFIDSTVVNVALPALQDSLGATAADVQWVIEAYALLLSALLLVGGSLGDRYGRRRVFGIGVAVFGAASVWCGLAPDVGQLIVARAAQGVGAALLIPGSLAIIRASFDEERRGMAIGTWSGFTAITAGIGPLLGGWLIDNASWRWVFYINVPVGLLVLALLTRVPESRGEDASALDLPGAVLATLGLGGVVYGLIEAGQAGWSHPPVLAALGLGSALLVVFLIVESRSAAPMLPLRLFRSRTFSGANLLTLLLYAALGGALFLLPFNLIQVQGYSATAAGAALLPFIGLMFLLSRWAGGLVTRYGNRRPLIVGPLIAAVGFALFTVPGVGGSYWRTFFAPVVVLGLGMAVSVAPLTTVVMEAVDVRKSGVASGINNAVSRTASVLAVAIFGLVMTVVFTRELDASLQTIDPPPAVVATLEAQADRWAAAAVEIEDPALQRAVDRAVDEAFVAGFRLVMALAAVLAALSALSAWTLIGSGEASAADAREPAAVTA